MSAAPTIFRDLWPARRLPASIRYDPHAQPRTLNWSYPLASTSLAFTAWKSAPLRIYDLYIRPPWWSWRRWFRKSHWHAVENLKETLK